MVKLRPPLTTQQQIAIAIVPKFTSALSVLGSGFIIVHVLINPNRRQRVYHRILLGMGLMDVVVSVRSFLSTWPLPKGTAWGAMGTTQMCALAGFFGQGSGLAGPLYNGSLTLYYFLTIRDRARWREERIRTVEPWLHAVPLVVGWSTAIAGMVLKLFNPIGWTCWIGPWPPRCKQTYEYGYTTCERGDNSDIYRWAFFHGELWLTFFLTFAAMVLVHRAVLRAERITGGGSGGGDGGGGGGSIEDTITGLSAAEREESRARGSFSQRQQQGGQGPTPRQAPSPGEHSRKVMVQASLFVAAFFVTWIFPAITWVTQAAWGQTFTIILFLQAAFVPLQGAFNALIYLRPRYLRNLERHGDEGIRMVLWRTLRSQAPPPPSWQRNGSATSRDDVGARSSTGNGSGNYDESMDVDVQSTVSTNRDIEEDSRIREWSAFHNKSGKGGGAKSSFADEDVAPPGIDSESNWDDVEFEELVD